MRYRYEIRRGRFGLYFYDTDTKEDVDMHEALEMLNKFDNLVNLGKQLGDKPR